MAVLCIGVEDFNPASSMEILIPGGHDNVIFDIYMVDDVVVEDNEVLRISINPNSLPYGVTLGNITSAEIIILDNDSKCYITMLACLFTLEYARYICSSFLFSIEIFSQRSSQPHFN